MCYDHHNVIVSCSLSGIAHFVEQQTLHVFDNILKIVLFIDGVSGERLKLCCTARLETRNCGLLNRGRRISCSAYQYDV